jgi:hypothetical protein
MIDFARRHQRPGSGSLLRLTDWNDMESWPDLTPILNNLRWAIAGGVATRSYMPERATKDLDIVVLSNDISRAREALENAGFAEEGRLTIPGSMWRAPSGQALDVLIVDGSFWVQALARAREHLDPNGSPVLALPDLVLMKLRSGRHQDQADVSRMLGFADAATLNQVREVIKQNAPELHDDVESMIELGKLEHESELDS